MPVCLCARRPRPRTPPRPGGTSRAYSRVDRALALLQTPAVVLTDIDVRERDERAAMNGIAIHTTLQKQNSPKVVNYQNRLRGLAQFIPIARFSVEEHRARVDGRATARHLHGTIERAVRCGTVKVSAESAGAVASTMFLESLPTRQSGRLAQPDGGAGTPAGRGCHLQGRSAPPSWTTP